ncbi:MAG: hypothetical protein QF898_19005, partial [SAR202 cluster bacterium]|nr:hypothetical protein [SAR202 cluster bacterium]
NSHFTVTDTKTGKSEYISQTGNGNRFRVPGSTTGEIDSLASYKRNAPHSMALGLDGKYYVTNTATNAPCLTLRAVLATQTCFLWGTD